MKKITLFTLRKRNGKYGAASRSQALLEFALALPILLMLIFGIIDLAALFQAWLTVENISRQTVRYAVTGQYELNFCQDGPDEGSEPCAGAGYEAEQDAARLRSIEDYANRQIVALFYTPGAAQPEIGHLNITICSTRDANEDNVADFTFTQSSSQVYADCQAGGVSKNDAGAPGDRVIIAVDFNHPYITPIFNQIWPMTHLFSHREGIVEMFRVPRLIALPDNFTPVGAGPTFGPSATTEPPTNTPSPTVAPPIYIEITSPDPSGLVITRVSQTRFEAIAWNPPFGNKNGDGITNITFWFSGPGTIPGRIEGQKNYCAFSGNSSCSMMDAVVDFGSLPNGTYTIFARAYGVDGRYSDTVSKDFELNFPPTPTPTITSTPTATPVPSCNDVFISLTEVRNNSNSSDFRVTVRNNNQAPGLLTRSTMTWNSIYSPTLYFDYFWFLNANSANRYHNPSGNDIYDTTYPTIAWNSATGAPAPLAGEAKTIWGARFNRSGNPALAGTFNVSLTFFFPELGECVVTTSLVQSTPSPSPIPPTNTPVPPTPTPICKIEGAVYTTDRNGNPQNVNGYDCAFGCVHSPYLSSNQLPPGNYFWTVETVGNPKVVVNSGTFSLNPGQQAGPDNGLLIPLGRNMFNVPPGYFPGEFKVSVYQSSDPGCNAKTDNFKILALLPSPTPTDIETTPPPTNTKKPTSTPRPTDTPTPTIQPTLPPWDN